MRVFNFQKPFRQWAAPVAGPGIFPPGGPIDFMNKKANQKPRAVDGRDGRRPGFIMKIAIATIDGVSPYASLIGRYFNMRITCDHGDA